MLRLHSVLAGKSREAKQGLNSADTYLTLTNETNMNQFVHGTQREKIAGLSAMES